MEVDVHRVAAAAPWKGVSVLRDIGRERLEAERRKCVLGGYSVGGRDEEVDIGRDPRRLGLVEPPSERWALQHDAANPGSAERPDHLRRGGVDRQDDADRQEQVPIWQRVFAHSTRSFWTSRRL